MRIVVDTNVFVAALSSPDGASREVLRRCLQGRYIPLMGQALMAEYESVLSRSDPFVRSPTTDEERRALWSALANRSRWVRIYYLWRPNLPDEADNHLVELAIAGGAENIVTYNTRDFARTQLHLRIPVKLDGDSGGNWSLVPGQTGQSSERSDAAPPL